MEVLLTVHSAIRWTVIVIGVLAIVKFAIGWAGNANFKGMDRGLASGFSGLLDAQALFGIVYLIWNGAAGTGFPAYRITHALIMFVAIVLAHVPARLKSLNDKLRFQYSLLAILGSLVLIFISLMWLARG